MQDIEIDHFVKAVEETVEKARATGGTVYVALAGATQPIQVEALQVGDVGIEIRHRGAPATSFVRIDQIVGVTVVED